MLGAVLFAMFAACAVRYVRTSRKLIMRPIESRLIELEEVHQLLAHGRHS